VEFQRVIQFKVGFFAYTAANLNFLETKRDNKMGKIWR
jgi:hypothetical protein